MSRNPKKGPFDLSVDLCRIPSFETRFASMDKLVDALPMSRTTEADLNQATDAENLRQKLRSNQDIRSNPNVILRRKGIRV